jgi:hypothetical protein
MLFSGDLFVSVPGHSALGRRWAGSLVDPADLLASSGEGDLRLALELVLEEAGRKRVRVIGLPRPEMFHSEMARAALRATAEGFTQHVCLTDGASLKTVWGVDNHVFFYKPADTAALSALNLLCRRAPEATRGLRSQINSHLAFGGDRTGARPAPVWVVRAAPPERPPAVLRPFFFSHYSAQDTANRIMQHNARAEPDADGRRRLIYLPLTEAGLKDPSFARVAAESLLRAYADPSELVVLRSPSAAQDDDGGIGRSIALMHDALMRTGIILPRMPLQNVFLAEADVRDDFPLRLGIPYEIYLHDGFDHWRHGRGFYEGARRVHVFSGDRDGGVLTEEARTLVYGPNIVARRIEPDPDRSPL